MRAGLPWLSWEDDLVRRMDSDGLGVGEVSGRLGRSRGAVLQRRSQLGVSQGAERCEHCGAALTQPARGRRRRFCGASCARRARRALHRPVACLHCGGPIPAERLSARFYCSQTCNQRAWYQRKKARNASNAR